MAKRGKKTAGSSSAEFLAADGDRRYVTIMLQNAVVCSFGFSSEEAVLDKGTVLREIGDSIEVRDELAREQINVIGNTAQLTWQEGPLSVRLNGYLT